MGVPVAFLSLHTLQTFSYQDDNKPSGGYFDIHHFSTPNPRHCRYEIKQITTIKTVSLDLQERQHSMNRIPVRCQALTRNSTSYPMSMKE